MLAGDWTRLALSAGCIESAVDSGIAAATAIRSEHAVEDLWGKTRPLQALERGSISLASTMVDAVRDEVLEVAETIRTSFGFDDDPGLVGELAKVIAKRARNGGAPQDLHNDPRLLLT